MSPKNQVGFLLATIAFAVISFGAGSCAKADPGARTLVIGLMPAVDAAPMLVAEKEGYFKDAGLDVSFVVFTNAMERQASLQGGAVDGSMTDLVAFALNAAGGFDLRVATMTDGMFPFLVRPGFAESGKATVAMMEASVSNFLADAWLSGSYSLEKIFVNDIPARLELVKKGKVDMACLPEPVASVGQLAGLTKRVFANPDGEVPDILAVSGSACEKKRGAIIAFLEAYDRGVEKANADGILARTLLAERFGLDPRVRDLMELPSYRPARLPEAAYLEKIGAWTAALRGKALPESWTDRMFETGAVGRR